MDEARSVAPDNDAVFQMNADFMDASWHSNKGDFEPTLTILDRLLEHYRNEISEPQLRYLYEQVQVLRGIVLAELQRLADALPLLEQARSFDLVEEDKALLYFHLGSCYLFVTEDYQAAQQAFVEAEKVGLAENRQAGLHYYVGYAYYLLKDYANAKREFLKAEEYLKSGLPGPVAEDLYKLLAYSCKGLRQTAEAEMYSRLAKPAWSVGAALCIDLAASIYRFLHITQFTFTTRL